jgi:integrase
MDFPEARDAVQELMRARQLGMNPIAAERDAAKKLQAQQDQDATDKADRERKEAMRPTVDTVAAKYLGVYVAEGRRAHGNKRTKAEDERLYRVHVQPKLGTVKIDELRTSMIATLRDGIAAPSERRKAIAVLRALLSHAVSDGLAESNPAIGVKTGVSAKRKRVLSSSEIRALWKADEVKGVRGEMLAAIKVQLLTGQRAGEVLAMRWENVNEADKTWKIPGSVAKNMREHVVPLSPQAYALISSQPKDETQVFTAHRAEGRMGTSSFAQVVTRVREKLALAHFTSHDLRRTAATRMANLKVLPHVIEAVINHTGGVISGVAAVYNLEEYTKEKKAALDAWAVEIERIAKSDEP